jgi:hypothetical protein
MELEKPVDLTTFSPSKLAIYGWILISIIKQLIFTNIGLAKSDHTFWLLHDGEVFLNFRDSYKEAILCREVFFL